MTIDAADSEQADSAQQIPQDSTPTWQMELLLSGGLVVAIVQLLGWLDANVAYAISPVRSDFGQVWGVGFVYLYSALVSTSIAFSCHLLLRGLWVALIGARSVYPKGIRWEESFGSKQLLAAIRLRLMHPDKIVEQLDNRSTLVFAFGILLLAFFGFSTLIAIPFIALPLILIGVFSIKISPALAPAVFAGPLLLLWSLAMLIEKIPIRWLGEQTFMRKAAVKFNLRMSQPPVPISLLSSLLLSNMGRWRGTLAMFSLMMAAILFSVYRISIMMSPQWPDLFHTQEPIPRSFYYAESREMGGYATAPYVDSQRIRDDYLLLRVPYQSEPFNDQLSKLCEVDPSGPDTQKLDPFQAKFSTCVHQMLKTRLNQTALSSPVLLQSNDQYGGLELQLMIDLRTLSPGQHALTLEVPSRKEPRPHRIPFWYFPDS